MSTDCRLRVLTSLFLSHLALSCLALSSPLPLLSSPLLSSLLLLVSPVSSLRVIVTRLAILPALWSFSLHFSASPYSLCALILLSPHHHIFICHLSRVSHITHLPFPAFPPSSGRTEPPHALPLLQNWIEACLQRRLCRRLPRPPHPDSAPRLHRHVVVSCLMHCYPPRSRLSASSYLALPPLASSAWSSCRSVSCHSLIAVCLVFPALSSISLTCVIVAHPAVSLVSFVLLALLCLAILLVVLSRSFRCLSSITMPLPASVSQSSSLLHVV